MNHITLQQATDIFLKNVNLQKNKEYVVIIGYSPFISEPVVKIIEGTTDKVNFTITEIRDFLKDNKCMNMIFMHNHPIDAGPTCSDDDCIATWKLYHYLKVLDIELVDHLILSEGNKVYSFKADKAFKLYDTMPYSNIKEQYLKVNRQELISSYTLEGLIDINTKIIY